MPGLTIATGASALARPGASSNSQASQPGGGDPSSRSSSPEPPPVSPITPMLGPTQLPGKPPASASLSAAHPPARSPPNSGNPAGARAAPGAGMASPIPDFAQGRQAFTHSQPDQVGVALPLAEPISFDDNPDVLALKSAITILQLQRNKATADMRALSHAKADALADPQAFLDDLQAGRVHQEGELRFAPGGQEQDEDEDSSSEGEDADGEERDEQHGLDAHAEQKAVGEQGTPEAPRQPAAERQAKKTKKQGGTTKKSWYELPKAQNIFRCPPINWAQYGVVGESLDKLHAEQVAMPTQGVPAMLGVGGAVEFKAGDQPTGEQRRLVGVAAPYAPGKDKLDKKAKGAKK